MTRILQGTHAVHRLVAKQHCLVQQKDCGVFQRLW